jgi:hypothetical protein
MPGLAALEVSRAIPRVKAYKRYEKRGLFLLVHASGSKIWRFKYKHCGEEKQIGLGQFSGVSLAQATEAREAGRLDHVVPLSRQARALLKELHAHTFLVLTPFISSRINAGTLEKSKPGASQGRKVTDLCLLRVACRLVAKEAADRRTAEKHLRVT